MPKTVATRRSAWRSPRRAIAAPTPPPGPVVSARAAGLRYVSDRTPGIRRLRAGKGFAYLRPSGERITDPAELRRIRALVLPPAWREVWICPDPTGHIQATARDARGRKQYRYHPRYRQVRDETKFERLISFSRTLPAIRRRVAQDLQRPGLPREKVIATLVRLLEMTHMRVGNPEYVRQNRSYGLSTLRSHQAEIRGATLRLEFRGKSGKEHTVEVNDARVARVVQHCQSLPGEELFQYVDENGARQSIDSGDINQYLRETAGMDLTTKDFRTWSGTVIAARALAELGPPRSNAEARRNIVRAIDTVAARLGNTRAVCRKYYIHPLLLEAYTRGIILRPGGGPGGAGVRMERAVTAFLKTGSRRKRAA